MSVEIQWTEEDPDDGTKQFVQAERFAGKWTLKRRAKRRENWQKISQPTKQQWEALLEALERRLQRREGVTELDLAFVRKNLSKLAQTPKFDANVAQSTIHDEKDADSDPGEDTQARV